jgi:hypothetical protein
MKDVGVARREKIVEGILGFAASENGPPAQREQEAVSPQQNVIASITSDTKTNNKSAPVTTGICDSFPLP